MKLIKLFEGTWSYPYTVAQAQKLAKLMKSTIPAGRATSMLYHIIGDDSMYDMLDQVAREDGYDSDCRTTVQHYLEKLYSTAIDSKWEEGAKAIVMDIIQSPIQRARTPALNRPRTSNAMVSRQNAMRDHQFRGSIGGDSSNYRR